MNLTVELPDDIAARLSVAGGDLSRRALEALLAEEYRRGRVSVPELERVLGISGRDEISAFLRAHDAGTGSTRAESWRVGALTADAIDWSQCPAVESVPGKVSGAWVLKGTRMPVAAIFENLEAGANIDDILEWFAGLDRAQVQAVIEFAVRSLDKPPTYAP